ncbi:MAG: DUF1883 domain-containing protein [Deltaproteobacteria bacterium]|nr:DUF1883 domain-containing protein [Deltaproteobacteria bacterium]
MHFIHSRKKLNMDDVMELTCDSPCNFILTDDSGFTEYKQCGIFGYFGGHFKTFPARITVPHTGEWNIVIDTPGGDPINAWNLRVIS